MSIHLGERVSRSTCIFFLDKRKSRDVTGEKAHLYVEPISLTRD
jgi:hypothetical protein